MIDLNVTSVIVIVIFLGLLTWTAYAQQFKQPTLSMTMRMFFWNFTTASFITGALIGHWSGSLIPPITGAWGYLIPFLIATLTFDIVWGLTKGWGARHPSRYPVWYILLGIAAGLLFWGQQ